ncbi:hypothetical protein [Streptomyces sp. CL7]|uniref:hypothetical protein n=1 Tax=Streptomyces sp. CL7 TaxID=3096006 RepID=UPI002A7589BF|nr:hypothetical protein [Streptomyces sp. CL7]WPP33179.1 hypothetical protein SJH97_29280 [Streptomyces sp. CL7]
MSNLGRYQEFTTQAKEAGGVDKLIEALKEAARNEAAPGVRWQGIGIGAVGTLAAAGVTAFAVSQFQANKRAREEAVNEAEERLKKSIEGEDIP